MTPPLLSVFFYYFPFFPRKSRQCDILNNVFMNLLGLSTKHKIFKYLDMSVTSVELNYWPRKNGSKINKLHLILVGHYRLYRAIF